jgi:hypothetical protein
MPIGFRRTNKRRIEDKHHTSHQRRQKIEIELRSDIYGQVNPNHPIPKQNMDIKNHSFPGLSRYRSQASHRGLTTRQQTVQDDNYFINNNLISL